MLDGSGFQLGIAVLARELGYLDGTRVQAGEWRPRPRRRLLRRIVSWARGLSRAVGTREPTRARAIREADSC